MLFNLKQAYQRIQTYKKRRKAYLNCNLKCFHEDIEVNYDNIAYNIHFIPFKKSTNDYAWSDNVHTQSMYIYIIKEIKCVRSVPW